MIQPLLGKLSTQRIVLASSSPRRKQILENIGFPFEVVPSSFEENLDKTIFSKPYDFVKETAQQKGLEVAQRLQNDEKPPDLIIGADTVVTMDNAIFEKPKNEDDAFEMLSRFSGRTHTVCTGVVLIRPKPKAAEEQQEFLIRSFHESTEVVMTHITPEIINSYIKTKEPMDKAGAYGIQGIGGTLIEAIHGDYFNVMGFPLHKFCKELCCLYKA